MEKRHCVTLIPKEWSDLKGLIGKGKGAVRKLVHASIPLQADEAEGSPGRANAGIAETL
jgi:hypothetical protein